MQRLILLRHAEAERQSLSGDDFDRGLTPAGRAEAEAVGRRLVELGYRPDLVLVSTARRANETWAALEAAFPGVRVEPEPELYEASPKTLLRAAEDTGEAGTVMLVAHNPGLHSLALRLGASGPLSRGLPTGHAAVFVFDPWARTPSFEALVAP